MKHVKIILTAVLLGVTCGFENGALAKDGGAMPAASRGQKQQYEKQVQEKFREFDREIVALKARSPQDGRELQEQFNREMGQVEKKRKDAQRELEKFKDNSQQAWRDAKPELDAAMKNLETAYERAAADFKQKGKSE